jgi:hypothetical protein
MKIYLIPAIAICMLACNSAPKTEEASSETTEHQLTQTWETDSLLKTPESVLFNRLDSVLYVSNIDGKEPWAADSKGSIAKVSLDGEIISAEWVAGLDAPKGLGMHNGKLFVADIKNLAIIDIATGKLEKKVLFADAQGLNDVTIDPAGVVYVSDSPGKQVFRYVDDKVELLLKDLKGPNGLLYHNSALYVLDAGGMFKMADDKSLTKIADGMEGNTDGLENIGGDDYIISCWEGAIWYVKTDGSKQLLLDAKKEGFSTADIGINRVTRTIYVPTFFRNTVKAFEVK